jgi:hypothetical protein
MDWVSVCFHMFWLVKFYDSKSIMFFLSIGNIEVEWL